MSFLHAFQQVGYSNNFFELKKELVKRERKGLHGGVRYVTHIDTKENAELASLMLNEGIRIRHVNNLPQ